MKFLGSTSAADSSSPVKKQTNKQKDSRPSLVAKVIQSKRRRIPWRQVTIKEPAIDFVSTLSLFVHSLTKDPSPELDLAVDDADAAPGHHTHTHTHTHTGAVHNE